MKRHRALDPYQLFMKHNPPSNVNDSGVDWATNFMVELTCSVKSHVAVALLIEKVNG